MLIEVIVATVGGTVTAISLGGMWLAKRLREVDIAEEKSEREHELKLEKAHRTPEEIAADLKEKEIAAHLAVETERLAAEERERKRKATEEKEKAAKEEKAEERKRRSRLPKMVTARNTNGRAVCPFCAYPAFMENKETRRESDMVPSGSYWYEHVVVKGKTVSETKAPLSEYHNGPCTPHVFVTDEDLQMMWRVCTTCGAEWFEKPTSKS